MSEDRLDRIEATLERMAKAMEANENVFNKRIAALIARDEALQSRHEALVESVRMIAHTLYRKGKQEPEA